MDSFSPLDNPVHWFGRLLQDYMQSGHESVLVEVADLGRLMAVTEFAIEAVVEEHGNILAAAIDAASRQDSGFLVVAAATVLTELFVAYRFVSLAGSFEANPGDRLLDPPTRFVRFLPGGLLDTEPRADVYGWLESQVGVAVSGDVRAAVTQRRVAMFEVRRTDGDDHVRLTVCPFHEGGGIIGIRDINRLVDARERAFQRRKLEMVGQLASRMAHELDNLLQPIVSATQMAAEDHASDAELSESLALILDSANRAADIVHNMLLYVRRAPKGSRRTWLAEMVAHHVNARRLTLPPGIRLDLRISPTAIRVAVDHAELGQIIRNLMANAVCAVAGCGEFTITVDELLVTDALAVGLRIPAGRYGRLAFADNGPGLPPALLERIFEPFFTTKEIGEGTGLGLSIVQGIVRSWGGDISAGNRPKGGAEFTILLPMVDATAIADGGGPEVVAHGGSPGSQAEIVGRLAEPCA
jgi:signal transduction histidine kinase